MDENPPEPVDSGFDEPDTLKPWPLCFTLFGLLLIVAIGYALLISLVGCTSTPSRCTRETPCPGK